MSLLEPIFEALNRAGVRYLVAGGLATVLHGFARLTADIDLIVDLDPVEARRTIDALVSLGMRPRPPVDPFDFADEATRRSWIRDKGLRVFSLYDPANPLREVDLFVEHPIDFAVLWSRSEVLALTTTQVRVVSIADLITLKRLAGRPQDLRDIEALEAIAAARLERDGQR
ncbi:MAG: hypothetical protein JXR83_08065 [Deltaproteobacteria bacterium]|nr:hypothetical protein [Deltaproteobacteria bacterium]